MVGQGQGRTKSGRARELQPHPPRGAAAVGAGKEHSKGCIWESDSVRRDICQAEHRGAQTLLGSAPLPTQHLVCFWKVFLERRNDGLIDFGD